MEWRDVRLTSSWKRSMNFVNANKDKIGVPKHIFRRSPAGQQVIYQELRGKSASVALAHGQHTWSKKSLKNLSSSIGDSASFFGSPHNVLNSTNTMFVNIPRSHGKSDRLLVYLLEQSRIESRCQLGSKCLLDSIASLRIARNEKFNA